MKRTWLPWLGLGAACVACCAPLIVPLLAAGGMFGLGAGAGFSVYGLSVAEAICAALIVTAVVGVAIVFIARNRAKRRDADDGAHCQIDGACAPAAGRKEP
ncbi:MAG: hypothetical protein FD124_3618 [Alphaproteobacteria bacterium]|nr:MAG: hypothetical protein FD160_1738 [Caulobacteraceae bacterium]TPW01765.1 MAG: hypothetical protein FD124_3618 [Alphaproteobacteria bacterium]